MASKKKIMVASSVENKRWDFDNNGVRLNFTLRVDIKEEMKNFLDVLDRARESIAEELNKRFPK